MGADFEMTMNEFLPLRDVVFNTLRKAILTGELKPGERLMDPFGQQTRRQQDSDQGSDP